MGMHVLPNMEEYKHLLAMGSDDSETGSVEYAPKPELIPRPFRQHPKWAYLYFGCLHLILLGISVRLYVDSTSIHACSDKDIYTPVSTPIGYEVKSDRRHRSMMRSVYTGWPNSENNRAWEDLIRPLLFNATAVEMTSANEPLEDSVQVLPGGYLASLGVYHELHCLRRIRLWLHRDTYYPNATRDDELFMKTHLGHCIEVLRLSAMCTADLGMYSFFWSSSDAEKPTARSSAPRKCYNWTQIDSWSRDRMIPNTHIPLLKNDQ